MQEEEHRSWADLLPLAENWSLARGHLAAPGRALEPTHLKFSDFFLDILRRRYMRNALNDNPSRKRRNQEKVITMQFATATGSAAQPKRQREEEGPSVPRDLLLASYASCTDTRPVNEDEAREHLRGCEWCAGWIDRHQQAQLRSVNKRSWATGYWK